MEENKKIEKKNRRNKRFRRTLIGALGISLFLLLAVQVVLIVYFEPLLSRILREVVENRSEDIYSAEIGELSVNMFEGEIIINSLVLLADTTPGSRGREVSVYKVVVPQARIGGLDLFKAYFQDELIIGSIKIKYPQVYFREKEQKVELSDRIFRGNELYPLLKDYFNSLKVNRILIEGGDFYLNSARGDTFSTFSMDNLSLVVSDFLVNETSLEDTSRTYYAKDYSVKIKGYSLDLADSLHVFRSSEVVLSTSKKAIVAKNIRIVPWTENYNFTQKELEEKGGIFKIRIPVLKITGLDFENTFVRENLSLEKIILSEADIRVYGKPENKKGADFKGFRNTVFPFFKSLKAERVALINSRLHLFKNSSDSSVFLSGENISGSLFGFQVDSADTGRAKRILFSDNFTFSINNFSFFLPDSFHRFNAGYANISTGSSRISAGDIRISPMENPINPLSAESYYAELKGIVVKGFDLNEAYRTHKLTIKELTLDSPDLKLIKKFTRKKSELSSEKVSINLGLNRILNEVFIDDFSLSGGNFNYQRKPRSGEEILNVRNIDLLVTDLRLDPSFEQFEEKYFEAGDVDFEFIINDYFLNLADSSHYLKAGKVYVSSFEKKIRATNLVLKPRSSNQYIAHSQGIGRSKLYEVYCPQIVFNGVDAYKAYFEEEMVLSEIIVNSPVVNILDNPDIRTLKNKKKSFRDEDIYYFLEPYLSLLKVNKVFLSEGEFRYIENKDLTYKKFQLQGLDLKLQDFRVDSLSRYSENRIFFAREVDLKLRDYIFYFPDSLHVLRADSLRFNTLNKDLYVENFRIIPRIPDHISEKHKPFLFELKVPKIGVQDVDIKKVYHNRKLSVSSLTFSKPVFGIYLGNKEKDTTEKKEFKINNLYSFIFPFLDKFYVNDLNGNGGFLEVYSYSSDGKELVGRGKVSMDLNDFLIDSNTIRKTGNPFLSRDLRVVMEDFNLDLPDAPGIRIDSLSASMPQQEFLVRGLRILKKDPEQNPEMEVFFPSISMEGVNYESFIEKNELIISRIDGFSPEINLWSDASVKKEKKTPSSFNTDSLAILISSISPVVSINEILFNDGKFRINTIKENRDTSTVTIPGLKLLLANIRIDSSIGINVENGFLQAGEYTYRTPDSLYLIKLRKINVSAYDNSLVLDSLEVIPRLEKYDFSQKVGHQVDRFEALFPRIKIDSLDLQAFFLNGMIHSPLVTFENANLGIFRNKQVPEPVPKQKKLFVTLLKSTDIPININKIYLHNWEIEYQELAPEAISPGVVRFERLKAVIFNIINDSVKIHRKELVSCADVSAYLMGSGFITANFSFPLYEDNDTFTFTGELDTMQFKAINPMLESSISVNFKSGFAQKVEFEIHANNEFSSGKMIMHYRDLKVRMLGKSPDEDRGLGKKIVTFIANTFVIISENPTSGKLRVGDIYFERDKSKSIFNFWWKSILSGIKSNIGVGDEKEKVKVGNKNK